MQYLPSTQNELVVALIKNDWESAKNICETSPQLINTEDEAGYTPLFHAMHDYRAPNVARWWEFNIAPEDVLLAMLKHASKECVEYKYMDDTDRVREMPINKKG